MAYFRVETLLKRWKSALKKAKTPALYGNDGLEDGDQAIARVKLFFPNGRWTWYITEWDGQDECYGYVKSGLGPDCDEWGYFTLSELATLNKGLSGWNRYLQVERDLYFKPQTVASVKEND